MQPQRVWICSPFIDFKGLQRYFDLIEKKIKDNVVLRILTRPGQKNEVTSIHKHFRKKKLEQSILFRFYHFSKKNRVLSGIHAKMVGADDSLVYSGSGEVRENSFSKNFELGIMVVPPLSVILKKIFDEVYSLGRQR